MLIQFNICIFIAAFIVSRAQPQSFHQILRSFTNVPMGRSISLSDIKIVYYRDSLKNKTSHRLGTTEFILQDTSFDVNKPTVLYIHGYIEYVSDLSVDTVMLAYIKHGGYNILALDWANLAFGNYLLVLLDINAIGTETGKALVKLVNNGLKTESLHIVGHSLGAHVGAVTGRHLGAEGYPVGRLTGLDPAFPGFYPPIATPPITSSDAAFVDVIHTSRVTYGSTRSAAHADCWPNGGARQRGCPSPHLPFSDDSFCSHWRSWKYWAESVLGGNFVAKNCDNYEAFLRGDCNGTALMGLRATPDLRGNFYLRTAAEEPFALGDRGVV